MLTLVEQSSAPSGFDNGKERRAPTLRHSCRNAASGWIRDARHAGTTAAVVATSHAQTTAPSENARVPGLTRYSRYRSRTRDSRTASGRPTTDPAATALHDSRSTDRRTAPRVAPSASRTPISWTRRATLWLWYRPPGARRVARGASRVGVHGSPKRQWPRFGRPRRAFDRRNASWHLSRNRRDSFTPH